MSFRKTSPMPIRQGKQGAKAPDNTPIEEEPQLEEDSNSEEEEEEVKPVKQKRQTLQTRPKRTTLTSEQQQESILDNMKRMNLVDSTKFQLRSPQLNKTNKANKIIKGKQKETYPEEPIVENCVGNIMTRNGSKAVFQTHYGKYYTLKTDGSKNYITKRVNEGNVVIYN